MLEKHHIGFGAGKGDEQHKKAIDNIRFSTVTSCLRWWHFELQKLLVSVVLQDALSVMLSTVSVHSPKDISSSLISPENC